MILDLILRIAPNGGQVFEAVMIGFATYWGGQLAKHTGLPFWLRWQGSRGAKAMTAMAAVAVVVMNFYYTGFGVLYRGTDLGAYILAVADTPLHGAMLSVRAAITEEILFRLLLGGVIAYLVSRLIPKASPRVSSMIIILATGVLFGLVHPNWAGVLVGIALAFVYFKTGLIPAMVVHFVADVIVFGFMIPFVPR
jgi:membrane protease YdiL (CAAX protease family)